MPDGNILTKPSEVDNYHGLKQGRTIHRLHSDNWTVEECALNKRLRPEKHIFNMPDGSVLIKCKEVDKYYGFRIGLTSCRLSLGWTEEECALNKRLTV